MILLDTSVIIDYWRKPRPEVAGVLSRQSTHICGVVLAELLQGAATEQDVVRTERALSGFRRVGVSEEVWRQLGLNLAMLRKAGVVVPFQDVLLATVAIVHDMELWALDNHYRLLQPVLKGLKLFPPP